MFKRWEGQEKTGRGRKDGQEEGWAGGRIWKKCSRGNGSGGELNERWQVQEKRLDVS